MLNSTSFTSRSSQSVNRIPSKLSSKRQQKLPSNQVRWPNVTAGEKTGLQGTLPGNHVNLPNAPGEDMSALC